MAMDPETQAVFNWLTSRPNTVSAGTAGRGFGPSPSTGPAIDQLLAPYGKGGQSAAQLLAPYGGQAAAPSLGQRLAPFTPPGTSRVSDVLSQYERGGTPVNIGQRLAGYGGAPSAAGAAAQGMSGAAGPTFGPPSPGGVPGAAPGLPAGMLNALSSAPSGPTQAAGLAGRFLANPEATGIARYLAPGVTGGGAMGAAKFVGGRALGYGSAGLAASSLINAAIPGDNVAQQVLADTAMGAGLGATVGSIVPGIGTGIGAAVGGAAGATYGLVENFFGKDGPNTADQAQELQSVIASSDLSPESKQNLLSQYTTMFALAKTDEEKKAAYETMKAQLLTQIQVDQQQEQQTSRMLAMQAQAQQFISPVLQGMISSANEQASITAQLAGTLPKEFQGPALMQAARGVSSAHRVAAAYANQMQNVGTLDALQMSTDTIRNELAGRLSQQVSGTSGGGGSISDILASQATAPAPTG